MGISFDSKIQIPKDSSALNDLNSFSTDELFSPTDNPFAQQTDSVLSVPSVSQILYREDNTSTLWLDERLEDSSKIALDTFNRAFADTFRKRIHANLIRIDYQKHPEQLDFSMLINPLGKIFETEINCSIIQWLRYLTGVEMPDFYNRVKPNTQCWYMNVDLNKSFNNQLSTIPIGTALELIMKCQSELPDEIGNSSSNFFSIWRDIRNRRNAASHPGVVDEKDFVAFYRSFCELITEGWFTQLMNLKCKLKPQQ